MTERCGSGCKTITPNLKEALGSRGNLLDNLRENNITPETAVKELEKTVGEGLTLECYLCVVRWEAALREALKREKMSRLQGIPKSKPEQARENRNLKKAGHNGRTKKLTTVNNIKR